MRGRLIGRRVVLVLLVGLVAWVTFTAQPGDPCLFPPKAGEAIPLYLIDNGFHSDVVLARQVVMSRPRVTARAAAMTSANPWIEIGWGDAKFYTGEGFSTARALDAGRALFWPGNSSVVRMEGLPRAPDQYYAPGAVKVIWLSRQGVKRLLDRVDRSLATGADGLPVRARAKSDPNEAFFNSVESFSVAHLCNHWTAGLLAAAGVPTTPVLDTLPAGLKLDLRLRAGVR